MKKLLRIFLFIIVLPVAAVVIVQVAFYLSAPIYDFSEPQEFTGSKLYNPYKNMDNEFWRKYNFQVQSKAWGGVTDGRKNTNELIDSVYRELGFDYVATSDYMKINDHGQIEPAGRCGNVGDVAGPDLIGFVREWLVDQQVWRRSVGSPVAGSWHVSLWLDGF